MSTVEVVKKDVLLSDQEIRGIVAKWFPYSPDSLKFAYKNDIRELARDFAFHIAAAQVSKMNRLASLKE